MEKTTDDVEKLQKELFAETTTGDVDKLQKELFTETTIRKDFNSDNSLEHILSLGLSERDGLITDLLRDYVKERRPRIAANTKKKNAMFVIFAGTYIVMTLGVLLLSWKTLKHPMSMPVALTIASLFLAYISSIMIVLRTITQYLFPVDEEKNVTEMIKAVVQKDIEQQKNLAGLNKQTSENKI